MHVVHLLVKITNASKIKRLNGQFSSSEAREQLTAGIEGTAQNERKHKTSKR